MSSNCSFTNTWHPSLDVGVKSYAMSSKSSSLIEASSKVLNNFGSRITWQVEQANYASQAPSISISLSWATYKRLCPLVAFTFFNTPSLFLK